MTDFNPIGELLKQAQVDNTELQTDATVELLRQAVDHLGDSGAIPDMRLRCWLIDYLDSHARSLPQRPRGRPDNFSEQFDIAVRVERARNRGLSRDEAITHVEHSSRFKRETVEQYYKKLRGAAQDWIDSHGPRLPARD
jgi:hypothetical protein